MNTENAIAPLIRSLFGQSPLRITPTHGGQISTAFIVELPGRTVVVKTHARADVYAGTARNIEILRNLGLPVPHILAADLTQSLWPFSYLILSHFPGRELRHELAGMSERQMARLARQIVQFQQRVATLANGTGYGYVNIGETGKYHTWQDLVGNELPARDTGELSPQCIQISRLFEAQQAYLLRVPPTCFLDDITVKNVIMQQGELMGLIDFDCVCYGDPLWHLALTTVGVVADVGRLRLFYADALEQETGLSADQRRALALYRAIMGVEFLGRCGPSETPEWRAQMTLSVDAWIREAS